MKYFETSSKTGEGVKEAFDYLVESVYNKTNQKLNEIVAIRKPIATTNVAALVAGGAVGSVGLRSANVYSRRRWCC